MAVLEAEIHYLNSAVWFKFLHVFLIHFLRESCFSTGIFETSSKHVLAHHVKTRQIYISNPALNVISQLISREAITIQLPVTTNYISVGTKEFLARRQNFAQLYYKLFQVVSFQNNDSRSIFSGGPFDEGCFSFPRDQQSDACFAHTIYY